MPAAVCPWPRCGRSFEVSVESLGRSVCCAHCGAPATARSGQTVSYLRRRQDAVEQGATNYLARDGQRPLHSPLLRAARQPSADALEGWDGGRFDPRYEAASERPREVALPNPNLAVLLDDLRSQWNVGSIFRTADCAGWGAVDLAGITPVPPANGVVRVALGAERYLPWIYRANVIEQIYERRQQGFSAVALEQTSDAVSVFDFDPPARLLLCVGSEVGGLSAEALSLCQQRLRIPVFGRKGSLNAAVAFGIAAFCLAERWRRRHGPAL